MARLPDSLQLEAPRGERPSTDVVQGGDPGFARLGEQLGQSAGINREAQVAEDQEAAKGFYAKFLSTDQPAYAAAAAGYTPDQPAGFAKAQVDATAKRVSDFMATDPDVQAASPGVRAALTHQLAAHQVARGEQAADYEGTVRAEPIKLAQEAVKTSQISDGVRLYQTTVAPLDSARKDGFDGSQPGYAAGVAADHDQAAQIALAVTPEDLRPQVKMQLAAIGVKKQAEALQLEDRTRGAYLLSHATDNLNATINTINDDPGQYSTVVDHIIPAAVAALPIAADREKFARAAYGEAVTARIKGLIGKGQADTAATELASGKYDAMLAPKDRESLDREVQIAQNKDKAQSVDQIVAGYQLDRKGAAFINTVGLTGQPPAGMTADAMEAQIAATLGNQKAAQFRVQYTAAQQANAAVQGVSAMSTADLHQAANAPQPTDGDPAALTHWQITQQAAQAELAARSRDPGAWAWGTAKTLTTKGRGKLGAVEAASRGVPLQQEWTSMLTAGEPSAQAAAGKAYAADMLGAQESRQIAQDTWKIVPQDVARGMVADVAKAAPTERAAALMQLATVVRALPTGVKAQNGTMIPAQGLLMSQLKQAGLTPMDAAAVADFGTNQNAMTRYVSAALDPTLKKPLDPNEQKQLTASVTSALNPYFRANDLDPDSVTLNQARTDRTVLIARQLVEQQHMGVQAAAKQAASDLVSDKVFVDGWSAPPAALSNAVGAQGLFHSPTGTIQAGAARTLADLTAKDGAGLLKAASGPANAAAIQRAAQWKNRADGSGLQLMVPVPGGYTPVLTQWGEPVSATWSQLAQRAPLFSKPIYGADRPAPPSTLQHPDSGAPVPAATRGQALSALSSALEATEASPNGSTSPKGAVGVRQVMPAVVAQYAPRLGLPVDMDRARTDPAYNRAISNAKISDDFSHYGSMALTAIAYNAGRGVLDGYHDGSGNYHPGLLATVGDPRKGTATYEQLISHLAGETQRYVRPVLARTIAGLHQ